MDVRLPDGTVIRNVPEGTTRAQLVQKLQSNGMNVPKEWMQASRALPKDEPIDPTEGMSGTDKFLAGVGKAMVDVTRGVRQYLPESVGGLTNEQIAEARALDAPLMRTGAGMAGNVVGNVAMAAPAAFIPGAATVPGAALVGAGYGALQPGVNAGERLTNTAIGGVASAAVPAAVRAGQVAKSFIEPMYQGGRNQIVGRAIRQSAGNQAHDAVRNMRAARELVPGSMPTAAQVAQNGGISALERTASQLYPEPYASRAIDQAAARVRALRGMAGDESQRAAQEALVQKTAKKLYGEAFKESVDVTPDLVRLASRPSMRAAEKRAVKLADELSAPFKSTLENLRPKYVAATARPMEARVIDRAPNELLPIQTPERWVTAPRIEPDPAMRGLGVTREVNDLLFAGRAPQRYVEVPGKLSEQTIPAGRMAQDLIEIPPMDSVPVRDMHTLKMGMDALLGDRTLGIAGREADAIRATRERLIGMMPESYQTARQAHIQLNKPIHQMDIASELINKATPALADFGALAQETGGRFAQAMRSGDELAKNVTGLKNATMKDIMTPDQLSTLNAIGQDLARKANVQNIGRGVGSDTVQKLAFNNILQQSGFPSAIQGFAPAGVVGNVAQRFGQIAYRDANEAMAQQLARALLDPQMAAQLMETAATNPSTAALIQGLRRSGAAIGSAAPAMIQANQE